VPHRAPFPRRDRLGVRRERAVNRCPVDSWDGRVGTEIGGGSLWRSDRCQDHENECCSPHMLT
jgi:hypothetical protein